MEQNFDNINHPARYCRNGVECIDIIEVITANLTGKEAVCIGNAVKYLFRFKDKGGVEDLKKAIKYIEMAIDCEEKKGKEERESGKNEESPITFYTDCGNNHNRDV